MPVSGKCARHRIAERGTFSIEVCDCGIVHLTIGCLTLRLDPPAYCELADAIGESLHKLQAADKPVIH
jgi:hypothetical protein